MKIISQAVFDQLSKDAVASERQRKNLNMHDDYADPCQRLFNAMEPGTYIRPHRHTDPPKPECFLAVRGRMLLVVFDDDGGVEQAVKFGDDCAVQAIELPAGVWHSLIALEPGSLFFETKPGPYVPVSDKDFASWSPAEGSVGAGQYLLDLTKIAVDYC